MGKIICKIIGHKLNLNMVCLRCGKDQSANSKFWKKLKVGDVCLTDDLNFAKCTHVNKGFSLFADFEVLTSMRRSGDEYVKSRMNCDPSELIHWRII